MKKRGFTIIEVVAVFLLILGVTFFIVPLTMDDTIQAQYISKWKEVYSDTKYMFSVIKAQSGNAIQERLANAKNNETRSAIILDEIRPYLRIKSGVDNSKYQPVYMDGAPILNDEKYFLDNFYNTESGKIVGTKWLTEKCENGRVCGLVVFDINGIELPNVWGKDIFGIHILKNDIQPIGQGTSTDSLKKDCSQLGHGLYCSYYYLIGGHFD